MDHDLMITEADRRALAKCPKGWFDYMHDSVILVRCVEFRLKRLVDRGLLERKLKSEWGWLYRLTATGRYLNNAPPNILRIASPASLAESIDQVHSFIEKRQARRPLSALPTDGE